MFRDGDSVRQLDARPSGPRWSAAFERYLETIPEDKRFDRDLFYELRDVVGKSGFGIGSAGLPAYNLLVEGFSQALDNDVVLSMKQANIPAVSRFVDTGEVDALLRARGAPHRRQPAGAAGAHRPDARAHHARRGRVRRRRRCRRTRSTSTGRASPSPTTSPPSSTCSAGPPPRSTAPPTRTASRTSSTSRSRRRSPSSLDRRRREFTAWLTDFGIELRRPRCARDHALFVERVPRGPDRGLRDLRPAQVDSADDVGGRRRASASRCAGGAKPAAANAVSIARDHRVDPLLGHQRDRRAAEPAAGHPGADARRPRPPSPPRGRARGRRSRSRRASTGATRRTAGRARAQSPASIADDRLARRG